MEKIKVAYKNDNDDTLEQLLTLPLLVSSSSSSSNPPKKYSCDAAWLVLSCRSISSFRLVPFFCIPPSSRLSLSLSAYVPNVPTRLLRHSANTTSTTTVTSSTTTSFVKRWWWWHRIGMMMWCLGCFSRSSSVACYVVYITGIVVSSLASLSLFSTILSSWTFVFILWWGWLGTLGWSWYCW